MTEDTLDARGLMCPLPVLKARKRLLKLTAPARLTVRVSDPATEKDFRLFCEDAGYGLSSAMPNEDGITLVIEKI